jgi:hypothetical protein
MALQLGAKTKPKTVVLGSAKKATPVTKTITFKPGPVAKPSAFITITPVPKNISAELLSARNKGLKPLTTVAKPTSSPIIKANPIVVAAITKSNARTTLTPNSGLKPIIPSGNVSIFRVAQAATAATHGPNYTQQQYFSTLQSIKGKSDTVPLKTAIGIMDNTISNAKKMDNLVTIMKSKTGKPFSQTPSTPTKTIQFKTKPLTGSELIKAQIAKDKANQPVFKMSNTKYSISPKIKEEFAKAEAEKKANAPVFKISPVKISPSIEMMAATQKANENKIQFVANPLKLNTYTIQPAKKTLKIMAVNPLNPAKYDATKKFWLQPVTDMSLLKTVKAVKPGKGPIDLAAWSKTNANPVLKSEYVDNKFQCLQFASKFVKASRAAGFDTYLVTLVPEDNNIEGHAMVGLKIGEYVYQYDPYTNADMLIAKNWNKINPALAMTGLLTADTTVLSNEFVNLIKETPTFIEANKTITKRLKSTGSFNVQHTIPTLVFFEPQFKDKQTIIPIEDLDYYENADGTSYFSNTWAVMNILDDPDYSKINKAKQTNTDNTLISDNTKNVGGFIQP